MTETVQQLRTIQIVDAEGQPMQVDLSQLTSLLSASGEVYSVIVDGDRRTDAPVLVFEEVVVGDEVVIAESDQNDQVTSEQKTEDNEPISVTVAPVPIEKSFSILPRKGNFCDVCQCQFPTRGALVAHKRSKHARQNQVTAQAPKGKCRDVIFVSLAKKRAAVSLSSETCTAEKRPRAEKRPIVEGNVNLVDETMMPIDAKQKSSQDEEKADTSTISEESVCIWQCDTCQEVFFDNESLLQHVNTHEVVDNIETVKGDIEEEEDGEVKGGGLKEGVLVKRNQNEYVCPACEYMSYNKKHFSMHLHQKHPGEKLLQCQHCDEKFHSMRTFTKHVQTHGGDHICPSCGKAYSNQMSLSQHMKGHCEREQFVCDKCGKSTSSRVEYMKHRKTHELVTCDLCDKTLGNKYTLDTHMARIHGQLRDGVVRNLKNYYTKGNRSDPCPVCGKTYCSEAVLKHHMKEHAGEYTYQCETCGKPFNHKTTLNAHVELHQNLAYTCAKCTSVFRTRVALKTHERTVHCPKRHMCDTCGRKFATMEHLKAHRRTHTGEKPFECEYCSLAFAQVATLQNHVRNIHDKRKPYKCDRCDEEFHRPGQLEKHLQKYHGGSDRYQCVLCTEIFHSVRNLKSHLIEKHIDEFSSETESDD